MNGYAISPLVLAELRSALAYYRKDPRGHDGCGVSAGDTLAAEVQKVIARADEHDDAGERRAWEGFAQAALVATSKQGSTMAAADVADTADQMLAEWRARYARRVPR